MSYKKCRIYISKGWTLIVCSVSIFVLALMSSCRSKKVAKTPEPVVEETPQPQEVVDESDSRSLVRAQAPAVSLPNDSKEVKEMILEVNALKNELSSRMNSVIYGTPEVMQRRAEENRALRHQIDSIDNEINKARKK